MEPCCCRLPCLLSCCLASRLLYCLRCDEFRLRIADDLGISRGNTSEWRYWTHDARPFILRCQRNRQPVCGALARALPAMDASCKTGTSENRNSVAATQTAGRLSSRRACGKYR